MCIWLQNLIASGLYVIPNLNLTAYHVAQPHHPGKEDELKHKEFERNLKIYTRLKNEKFVSWTMQRLRNEIFRQIKTAAEIKVRNFGG